MAVVEEILRSEADGSISFGNHKLAKKAKVEDYEHAGWTLHACPAWNVRRIRGTGLRRRRPSDKSPAEGFRLSC